MKSWIQTVSLVFSLVALCSCGVKGDPLPPENAPRLGRGRPTFERATEPISYPSLPKMKSDSQLKELDVPDEDSEN